MDKSKKHNPWTPQDEGSHHPIMREWWTFETIFKTLEDKRKWDLMVIMSYNLEEPSCFYQIVLFDINSKKCVLRKEIDDNVNHFKHKKNKLDLKYKKNTAKGMYPNYFLHFEEEKQDFKIDMKLKSKSPPRWISQDVTDGEIPIGLNFYKYGYIPNNKITGEMEFKNKKYMIEGKGYIEHVWGEWSYQSPFKKVSDIRKTLRIYTNLGKWWISQHKAKIPKKIAFTTENNMFGYDWAWGVFDNDWSVFYGNILFWLCEGPAFGYLSVTTDKGQYFDFSNINFQYNKHVYVQDYDIYFPSDFSLSAKLDDKKIDLRFYLDTNSYEYIDPFKKKGFYKAFILSEMPGKMIGKYKDSDQTVKLEGDCKMMPLREPSSLGHNKLEIDFIKPPKGVGIDIDFNSHHLKKRINSKIQFAPKPCFKFKLKKIERKDFEF